MSSGRKDYDLNLVSFDDSKKVLTLKNLLPEAYRYSVRALLPVQFPVQIVIMYMIQSTEHVLAPDFISYFKKLDASSWDTRRALRYYIPGVISQKNWPTTTATHLEGPAHLRMTEIIKNSNVDLLSQQA